MKPRAASSAPRKPRPFLRGRENRTARRHEAATCGMRRHLVDAVNAHDFFDEIGRPAMSLRQDGGVTRIASSPSTSKAELRQNTDDLVHRADRCRRAAATSRAREWDCPAPFGNCAGDDGLRRLAAAEFENEFGREFEPRHDEFRIDAALEAIARVGQDTELAARGGDPHADRNRRIRRRRCVVASVQPVSSPPMMPPMPRAAFVVGNHAHLGIERVGLAVERVQRFRRRARAAPACRPRACRHRRHAAAGRDRLAMRLVTSTSAEIGRKPIARKRACSQPGLGPFFTLRIRRPANMRAGALGAMREIRDAMWIGHGNVPGTGCDRAVSSIVPRPAAARSRAMPYDARAVAAIGRDARHRSRDRRDPSARAAGAPITASARELDDALDARRTAEVRAPNTACRAIPRRGCWRF